LGLFTVKGHLVTYQYGPTGLYLSVLLKKKAARGEPDGILIIAIPLFFLQFIKAIKIWVKSFL